MKIIDNKGRLFGKLSLLDLLVAIVIIGLAAGFLYKRMSADVQQIVNPNDTFYVTIEANKLREYSANAIAEGDIMYRQHDNQPLGDVVKYVKEPATDYLLKEDGTAVLAPMEERYAVYVTVKCNGSVLEDGYYVNGTSQIAEGSEFVLVSNRLQINDTRVTYVGEEMPE